MSNGRHLILDLYDCDKKLLDDYDYLVKTLKEAVDISGATLLRLIGEKFEPQGVTLLALLAESHCSIHTWPCEGYCAIDLYTCGDTTRTHTAADFLRNKLKAKEYDQKEIKRKVFRDL
jgi:S-adenosylmethionine decarboxylase